MNFTNHLKYKRLTDKWVVLLEDLHFYFNLKDAMSGSPGYLREMCAITGLKPTDTIHVTAPKGFVSDLASVPKLLQPIFAPDGPYAAAAVIHDILYQAGEGKRDHNDLSPLGKLNAEYTRFLADRLFLVGMRVLGINKIKRVLMYNGVRLGGKSSYEGADYVMDYGINEDDITATAYNMDYRIFRGTAAAGVCASLTDITSAKKYHLVKFNNMKRAFLYPTIGNEY